MKPIWIDSYPAGVPAEIDVDAYRSIGELFEKSATKFAPKVAYVGMGREMTYAEVERLSRAFAAFLQSRVGLSRGARVALMMPNILQYPIALFGALRAGYTVVNCNPLYSPRELEHQLVDSGAEAIVVLENFAHVLEQAVARTKVRSVVVARLGDLLGLKGMIINFVVKHVKKMVPGYSLPGAVAFGDAMKAGKGRAFKPADVGPQDIAFLQYTGGTTGVPKGAMLTHRNIIANLQQAHAWLAFVLKEGEETIVTPLPLYHIFALTSNCLVFMKIGATNLLIANPRDIPAFIKDLQGRPFTAITGVNTLFNALLNDEEFRKLDFSHLKVALGGGMAVQRAVAERWKEVTGRPLIEAYGLTETSPAATVNPLTIESFTGSIGLPLPSTEVAIRDADGNNLPVGEVGELCVRGPQVMSGYWRKPEETAGVISADGFLRTGDLARMDDRGYFYIVDRKKDMIIVSGFNVYPNEIEDVVATHPGVLEVGAVGVPDDKSGEAVKIAVVKKDPNLTAEDIIAHCRRNLTGYKIPRIIEFREQLPKTAIGKILRRELRDIAPTTPG